MATDLRRFTISVTPDMKTALDIVKHECFYKTTQNNMLKDLILKGLDSYNMKAEVDLNHHDRST